MQGLFSKKQNSRSSELEKVAAEKRALEEEHAAFRQEMQQKMQLSSKKLQQLLQAHKALLENYLQDEPEETRRQVLEALNGEFGILDNPEV